MANKKSTSGAWLCYIVTDPAELERLRIAFQEARALHRREDRWPALGKIKRDLGIQRLNIQETDLKQLISQHLEASQRWQLIHQKELRVGMEVTCVKRPAKITGFTVIGNVQLEFLDGAKPAYAAVWPGAGLEIAPDGAEAGE